jgi:Transcription factor WhiB
MQNPEITYATGTQRSTMVLERIGAPLPPKGGSCANQETGWWFPPKAQKKQDIENSKAAVAICQKCPIRKECLEYALSWEAFGIWGGFTERQRDSIRKSCGVRSNVVVPGKSRTHLGVAMMVEHKELVWLKKNGFINATS